MRAGVWVACGHMQRLAMHATIARARARVEHVWSTGTEAGVSTCDARRVRVHMHGTYVSTCAHGRGTAQAARIRVGSEMGLRTRS